MDKYFLGTAPNTQGKKKDRLYFKYKTTALLKTLLGKSKCKPHTEENVCKVYI